MAVFYLTFVFRNIVYDYQAACPDKQEIYSAGPRTVTMVCKYILTVIYSSPICVSKFRWEDSKLKLIAKLPFKLESLLSI